MNQALNDTLEEVAADMSRVYSSYPSKSTEYTIWLQDLSKGQGGSRPLLRDDVRIGRSRDDQRVYDALMCAPLAMQRFFIVYYVTRWPRRKKIDVLGMKDKNEFYAARDKLHAFVEGALTVTKKVV